MRKICWHQCTRKGQSVDRITKRVQNSLPTKESWELRSEGCDEVDVPVLGDHVDHGVGCPDAEPQHHVRHRHLQQTMMKFQDQAGIVRRPTLGLINN
jgi:hypothetical protein